MLKTLQRKINRLLGAKDYQVFSTHLPEEYFWAKETLLDKKIPSTTRCVTGGRNAHILQYNLYVNERDSSRAQAILAHARSNL